MKVEFKTSKDVIKEVSQTYIELSSAKLQISLSVTDNSKSLIKMLKRIGPNTDP